MKRQRGRNRNKPNNNNSNRSLDSSGPDVKVRGSASTIYEKYTTLARDAASSGNRVKAENYRQHAEHYLRLVNAQEAAKQAAREEAEAARAARGGDDNSEGEQDEGRENSRRNRRYPPRVKRNEDKDTEASKEAAKSETAKTEPEGLDVVTPQADSPSDEVSTSVSDEAAQAKPKRRRKAPNRTKTVDEPAEIDAAE